jgi:N-methylhydantoinase A
VNQDVLRMDLAEARQVLARQVDEGLRTLGEEGADTKTVSVRHEADVQYVGQSHVLTVPLPRTRFEREELRTAFEQAYRERFDTDLGAMRCLVVSLRTAVVGHRRPVGLEGLAPRDGRAARAEPAGTRRVWFDGGWRETPVYRREDLPPGAAFAGPAIVEQLDSTTVVEPGDTVRVDPLGNLEVAVAPAAGA